MSSASGKVDCQAALSSYDLQRTPRESSLDRLTRIAARGLDAPGAAIISTDCRSTSVKSSFGIDLPSTLCHESSCANVLPINSLTVVTDAAVDSRLAKHPLIRHLPQIRFFVTAPLLSPAAELLGSLCVFDVEPRLPLASDLRALVIDVAGEISAAMEQRQINRTLADFLAHQNSGNTPGSAEIDRRQHRALLALEASNMGYWERDAETDLITFSPVLEQMLGLKHAEYDGSVKSWIEHIHPEDRQRVLDNIQQARATGRNYVFKYRPLTHDGSERWITTTGTYHKDTRGSFTGAYGVSWDSTDAEIAVRNLKLSEELFRVLSNSAPIGIFRSDLNKNLIYVNPALAAFNRVNESQLLGRKWMRFVHPDDRALLEGGDLHSTDPEAQDHYEHRLLLADGTVRLMHSRAVPLHDQTGKIIGKVGTVDDVTEQRRLLEDLKQAKQRAEIANRAKDVFLANVSHELRTPLNGVLGGVLGMSDLLLDSGLNEEQFEMAEIVRDSAGGLLSVVNDMLDLSRIEAGRLAIERQPFDLRATIQQTVAMFSAEARSRGLTLTTICCASLHSHYIGDPGRIRQILTNFLSNALKFTSSGVIAVEASVEVLDARHEILLSVRDSGCGIAPEDQAKLFRPFFQVDDSTTRRNGGAGLGLSICKRLAELMNGTVGLHSTPGKGSTFWAMLPLALHDAAVVSRSGQANQRASNNQTDLFANDRAASQRVALGSDK